MKKKILAILICALGVMLLSGCGVLYDALNFSNEKLPNIESPVDPALKNPYKYTENSVTKAGFDALISTTRGKMAGSCDENIEFFWQNNPIESKGDYGNGRTTNVFSRQLSYISKDATAGGKPYASFAQGYEDASSRHNYTFYDGYFVNNNTRYNTDGDFYDNIDLESFDAVESGSLMLRTLDMLSAGLSSVDSDWQNGRELYVVRATLSAATVYQCLDFDFDYLGVLATDYKGISASYTLDENGAIDSLTLVVKFLGETVTMTVRQNSFGDVKIDDSQYGRQLSAYAHHVSTQATKIFGSSIDEYSKLNKQPFKAVITATDVYVNNTAYETITYTLYRTRETFTRIDKYDYGKGDKWESTYTEQVWLYTAVLADGTKVHFVENYGNITVVKVGNTQNMENGSSEYYSYLWYFNINNLLDTIYYENYDNNSVMTYAEPSNGHYEVKIESRYSYNDWRSEYVDDERVDNEWIINDVVANTVVFDKETDNITGYTVEYKNYEYIEGKKDETLRRLEEKTSTQITVEYSFEKPSVPSSALLQVNEYKY